MAILSVIAFFDNVEQLTANPLAIIENIKPGCTDFATGNGSLNKNGKLTTSLSDYLHIIFLP